MSTSLIVGVLITIGVIALLIVVGLLSSGGRTQAAEEPSSSTPRPTVSEERMNGARYPGGEQTAQSALEYPRLASPREQGVRTLERERPQAQPQVQPAHNTQEDLQARYEKTLQELMALLQREQRPDSTTVSMTKQDEDDLYGLPMDLALPRRQIEISTPAPMQETTFVSTQSAQQPTTAHYSLVPDDEEAREKLPEGLSIPITVTLDGNVALERVPKMRIEVVIHIQ
ncbi:MAG: hypothetical protein NVS2B12_25650 [Ktedonobacteraceae bacterium]